MEILKDENTFDSVQVEMLKEIIRATRLSLEGASLPPEAVQQVTEELSFQIAALIDGSAAVFKDDIPYLAHLAFSKGEEREQIIMSEGGSWMHEYVFGTVEDVMGE